MFFLLKHTIDILFPRTCLFCHRFGYNLCPDCINKRFKPFTRRYCHVCHGVLRTPGIYIHKLCEKRTNLDGVFSSFVLNEPLKKYIKKIKYEFCFDMLCDIKGHINIPIEYDVATYIPLHFKRENYRGFNQSKLLALLVNETSVPLLSRTRDTPYQSLLNKNKRRKNVEGSFKLIRENNIEGKTILLIDDIYTTGSTMESCASLLKKNGALGVYGYTIGIDELPSDAYIIEQSIKTM